MLSVLPTPLIWSKLDYKHKVVYQKSNIYIEGQLTAIPKPSVMKVLKDSGPVGVLTL